MSHSTKPTPVYTLQTASLGVMSQLPFPKQSPSNRTDHSWRVSGSPFNASALRLPFTLGRSRVSFEHSPCPIHFPSHSIRPILPSLWDDWCLSGAALRLSMAVVAGVATRSWGEEAGAVGTTTTVAKVEGVPVAAAAASSACVQVTQLVWPVGSAT